MKSLITAMISIAFLATIGIAQESFPDKVLEKRAKSLLEGRAKTIAQYKDVISNRPLFFNQIVKNKPYSAEAVSESTQVLEDGNRITRSTTVKMYRDSEGRTRREGSGNTGNFNRFPSVGLSPFFFNSNSITIFDPVDSVRYRLNPKTKKARRYEVRTSFEVAKNLFGTASLPKKIKGVEFSELSPEEQAKVKKQFAKLRKNFAKEQKKIAELQKNFAKGQKNLAKIQAEFDNVVVMGSIANLPLKSGKSESLGTKVIEGVTAEGTRTVKTIEAGAIGNDLPIEITYEKWYSEDLEMIVYSRKYDPRSGEQIYRLININQTEPDSSYFTVPADYKIIKK